MHFEAIPLLGNFAGKCAKLPPPVSTPNSRDFDPLTPDTAAIVSYLVVVAHAVHGQRSSSARVDFGVDHMDRHTTDGSWHWHHVWASTGNHSPVTLKCFGCCKQFFRGQ